MKVYFLYRSNTESDVAVDNFMRLLNGRQQESVQRVDVDTRAGDDLSRLYSVMSYPTVLVATDDGRQVKLWHGSLPMVDELAVYLG